MSTYSIEKIEIPHSDRHLKFQNQTENLKKNLLFPSWLGPVLQNLLTTQNQPVVQQGHFMYGANTDACCDAPKLILAAQQLWLKAFSH